MPTLLPASLTPGLALAVAGFLLVASPAAGQEPAHDLSGSWVFTVVTENGTGTPSVTLRQEGDQVRGTYGSPRLGTRALEGRIEGDTLTFRLDPGEAGVVLTFVGVVQEDGTLSGWADFDGMGSATFTARRERSGSSVE